MSSARVDRVCGSMRNRPQSDPADSRPRAGPLKRNGFRFVLPDTCFDDLDAEVVQTLEQPADGAHPRAAVEVFWPEVLVRSTAAQHV
jgi:hypothetical protein